MLDHIGITVRDVTEARAFYEAALTPLGVGVVMAWETFVGFGEQGNPYFWIGQGETQAAKPHVHVAFAAQNRAQVDAFYAAAIKAGASDNGAPGLRSHYHENYYAAFVIDADGHNIEAVCHLPE